MVAVVLALAGIGLPSAVGATAEQPHPGYGLLVRDAVVRIARLLHVPVLSYEPAVRISADAHGKDWATEHSGPATPPTSCVITLYPAGRRLPANELRHTLVHEVAHCYQERYAPEGVGIPWLSEGSAAWIASEIEGRSKATSQYLHAYETTPRVGLFERSFSAIGFFAALACNGVEPGPLILPMMQTGDNTAAKRLALAARPDRPGRKHCPPS